MVEDAIDKSCASAGGAGCLIGVETADASRQFRRGPADRPFFLASATKLYVTAILCRLRARGLVDWDVPFQRFVPGLDTRGLHRLRGRDRTAEITVRHLLSHTSGLPDYFEGRRDDGPTTFARVRRSDQAWTVADVVDWSRSHQKPAFVPGQGGRALYSDTNYQLLGAVIEHSLGLSFAEAVQHEIARPLGLDRTWCFTTATLDRYDEVSPLRLDGVALRIPLAMASVGADGGMVSTVDDSIRFLRAFSGAELFPSPLLDEIQAGWRRIFFPLEYGTGMMRFALPWFLSPFRRFPPLVGHSGASGAFMFWCPETRVLLAGTVDDLTRRSAPFRLMLQARAAFLDGSAT